MEGIPQVVYVAPIRNFDENTQQIKKKGIYNTVPYQSKSPWVINFFVTDVLDIFFIHEFLEST